MCVNVCLNVCLFERVFERVFDVFQDAGELHDLAHHAAQSEQPGGEVPRSQEGVQQGRCW